MSIKCLSLSAALIFGWLLTAQTYTLYNGKNYSWVPGNGRSYQPCLVLYPVDVLFSFNGAGVGTMATAVNLTHGTEIEGTASWSGALAHLTFGQSMASLPGSIAVNNGPSHGCGYAGQTLVADDSFAGWSYNTSTYLTTFTRVVISGFINPGPTTGGYDSFLVGIAEAGGTSVGINQALQIGLLPVSDCYTTYGIHAHNTGPQCI